MEGIKSMFKELDELLRGRRTDAEALEKGGERLDVGILIGGALLLGACYGVFMGLFGALNGKVFQLAASALKVPLFFAFTIMVTYPSLYVFSAMTGARQGPLPILRVVLAAATVNLAVLASLGPITGFFTLTTTSYPFMKLLNVLFFGIAGSIALTFLGGALLGMETDTKKSPLPTAVDNELGSLLRRSNVQQVFRVWLGLYALVSLQMGWVLRPLIGDPQMPFVWFSPRGGSLFKDFFEALGKLLGG